MCIYTGTESVSSVGIHSMSVRRPWIIKYAFDRPGTNSSLSLAFECFWMTFTISNLFKYFFSCYFSFANYMNQFQDVPLRLRLWDSSITLSHDLFLLPFVLVSVIFIPHIKTKNATSHSRLLLVGQWSRQIPNKT